MKACVTLVLVALLVTTMLEETVGRRRGGDSNRRGRGFGGRGRGRGGRGSCLGRISVACSWNIHPVGYLHRWTHAFVLIPPPLYFCKDSSLYSFSLKTFIGLNTLHYRVPLSGIGGSKHEDFARVCANYSLTISVIFYI